jgi:hypothetical protein
LPSTARPSRRDVSHSRYERRSLLITANQPFAEWGKIFPDQAMTLAAIDSLVHHATIFEMNVDSYRRKAAIKKAQGPGRPVARTADALQEAVKEALRSFTPGECMNYFAASGYDAL